MITRCHALHLLAAQPVHTETSKKYPRTNAQIRCIWSKQDGPLWSEKTARKQMIKVVRQVNQKEDGEMMKHYIHLGQLTRKLWK